MRLPLAEARDRRKTATNRNTVAARSAPPKINNHFAPRNEPSGTVTADKAGAAAIGGATSVAAGESAARSRAATGIGSGNRALSTAGFSAGVVVAGAAACAVTGAGASVGVGAV